MIVVPTVKTLIEYEYNGMIQRVLTNIEMGDDKFAEIDFQNAVHSNCPFNDELGWGGEVYQISDDKYEIVEYIYDSSKRFSDMDKKYRVIATVIPVLEFKGRIFSLKELEYDEEA